MTSNEIELQRRSATRNPEAHWARQARELEWQVPFKKSLEWKYPVARWFADGRINACVNCVDRHVQTDRRNKAALIWESESGEVRTITYAQLHAEVCRFANVLANLGVRKGNVVGLYMGMVPEAVIAMLACARIGATHNVVFGGFSADALASRMRDSKAVLLITQDIAMRRGVPVELKATADEAVTTVPSIKHMVVLKRGSGTVSMKKNRDVWWHTAMATASATSKQAVIPSEHPLFILYTSGSTGTPKGILHTTGGYLTQVSYTMKAVFDVTEKDVYFCTADIGWITGHSYVVYGPLSVGATVMMYEGVLTHPEPDRLWEIVERHGVSILYTAPTAIRMFMRLGNDWPNKHNLTSLRILGSVGEPINPEAWRWYHEVIGKKRCAMVDTWWQTETGAIMISALPAEGLPHVPGAATIPLPGVAADVVTSNGKRCKANESGLLVIKHPWPAMLRTVYGNTARYKNAYWSEFPKTKTRPGWYFTGDGAKKDAAGNIWIIGRVDDVVNVSGHRLGTAEIESALVSHPMVAEAAIIAREHVVKGNALVAFVTLKDGITTNLMALKEELRNHVAKEIGHIAKPDEVRFTTSLPKTRSGKIMRRLLREVVKRSEELGDTSTLEDIAVINSLRTSDDE